MIDVDQFLTQFISDDEKSNRPLIKAIKKLLKRLLHQNEINEFINNNCHLGGFEFNDAVLEHFDFSFRVSNDQIQYLLKMNRCLYPYILL